MFGSFHIHPTVPWPFPPRSLRKTKLKGGMGFSCDTHMKKPGHGSPAPPRSRPFHMWRRFFLAHLCPHWESRERSWGHSHGVAFLCQSRLWAMAERAMTEKAVLSSLGSSAYSLDHESQGNSSCLWELTSHSQIAPSFQHLDLQRTKYAGGFYLHGSNLREHSKSPYLKNFSSNYISSYIHMHVLNSFLPSVPMMTACWCHSTDAGLQFCCSSGSSDVVCMSEYLEKILTYFFRVPLTRQQAFSFSQGREQTVTHEFSGCVALSMMGGFFSPSSLRLYRLFWLYQGTLRFTLGQI